MNPSRRALISILHSRKTSQVIHGENLLTTEKAIEDAARDALDEFSDQIEDVSHEQLISICQGLFVRSIAMLAVTSEEDPERGEIINELTKDICSKVLDEEESVPHLRLVR